MISDAIFNEINTASPAIIPAGVSFVYGNAIGVDPPYVVLIKRDDREKPVTLADAKTLGTNGVYNAQFSLYVDDSVIATEYLAEQVKAGIARVIGEIETTADPVGNTTKYMIDNVEISGCIPLNEGSGVDAVCRGAFFDAVFTWHKS